MLHDQCTSPTTPPATITTPSPKSGAGSRHPEPHRIDAYVFAYLLIFSNLLSSVSSDLFSCKLILFASLVHILGPSSLVTPRLPESFTFLSLFFSRRFRTFVKSVPIALLCFTSGTCIIQYSINAILLSTRAQTTHFIFQKIKAGHIDIIHRYTSKYNAYINIYIYIY